MSIAFISDLHLQESRPSMTAGFLNYLDRVEAKSLYILGDFFDYWIGDDDRNTFNLSIMDALKNKTEKGLPIYFMHGNRDFLIGEEFSKYTGVEILEENTILEFAGKRIVLAHGDALCTLDLAYMKFREMARNKNFQNMMLQRSLDERKQMAQHLRGQSKEGNQQKSMEIMDVTPDEVVKLIEESGADIFIHGHTHRPNFHQVELEKRMALRLVLGDWQDTYGYEARLDKTGNLTQTTFEF